MSRAGYEIIASEYYEERHITSRSFDRSTQGFCENFHIDFPPKGYVLELGCGVGKTSKYCRIDGSRIIQTDISMSMLKLLPRETHIGRCCCNALALPFNSSSVSAVTAFLFDPYNFQDLYFELYRVLAPNGIFVGTLPHITWGKALRPAMGFDNQRTVFYNREGEPIELPSVLMDDSEIQNSLYKAKLNPTHLIDLFLPKDKSPLSPFIEIPALKIGTSPYDLPIVKFIVARKEI